MNGSEMRSPPGGFEDRLEAELVKVVTARAALPGARGGGQPRACDGLSSRPVCWLSGPSSRSPSASRSADRPVASSQARLPRQNLVALPARFTSGRPRSA